MVLTTLESPDRLQTTCDLLSKRGILMVIRAMLGGSRRHSDILRAVPDLNAKTLSKRLRELEVHGIIDRIVHSDVPVRVEYVLTEKGSGLELILDDLERWVNSWMASDQPRI